MDIPGGQGLLLLPANIPQLSSCLSMVILMFDLIVCPSTNHHFRSSGTNLFRSDSPKGFNFILFSLTLSHQWSFWMQPKQGFHQLSPSRAHQSIYSEYLAFMEIKTERQITQQPLGTKIPGRTVFPDFQTPLRPHFCIKESALRLSFPLPPITIPQNAISAITNSSFSLGK